MAFQAFNFGKQLGIVGGDAGDRPNQPPVLVGRMEREVLPATSGGTGFGPIHGPRGDEPVDDGPRSSNPWVRQQILEVLEEINKRGNPENNPGLREPDYPGYRSGSGTYPGGSYDPPTDPDDPPVNDRRVKIKWAHLPRRKDETDCSQFWRSQIVGLYTSILESSCWEVFPAEFNLRKDIEDKLYNELIEIICESDPAKCTGRTRQERSHSVRPISDTWHFVYDESFNRGEKRERPLIRLCPDFFNLSLEEQWNTLLHELVHAIEGTEVDAHIIEFICKVGSEPNLPLPQFDPDNPASLFFWCGIQWGKIRGYETPVELTEDDATGHLFLKGKYFFIDVNTGEVFLRKPGTLVKGLLLGNVKGQLPPPEWFYARNESESGC